MYYPKIFLKSQRQIMCGTNFHGSDVRTLILGIDKTSFILFFYIDTSKATIDTKIMFHMLNAIFGGVRCVSFLLRKHKNKIG